MEGTKLTVKQDTVRMPIRREDGPSLRTTR